MKMLEEQQQAGGDAQGWDTATGPAQTRPGSPLVFVQLSVQGGRIVHSNDSLSSSNDVSPASVIPKPKLLPGKCVHPCDDVVSPVLVTSAKPKLPGNTVHPCDNSDTPSDDASSPVAVVAPKSKLPRRSGRLSADDNDTSSGDVSPVTVSPQRKTHRTKTEQSKLVGNTVHPCDDNDTPSDDVSPVKLSPQPKTTPQPKGHPSDSPSNHVSPVIETAEPPQPKFAVKSTLKEQATDVDVVGTSEDDNQSKRRGSMVTWADDYGLDLAEIREFEPSQRRGHSLYELWKRWKEKRAGGSSSSSSS